jgi:hypothetical protein
MNTLAWIAVLVVTNAATLLIMGLCASGAVDGAYHEGFAHGREVGRREGYAAALRDTDPAAEEAA